MVPRLEGPKRDQRSETAIEGSRDSAPEVGEGDEDGADFGENDTDHDVQAGGLLVRTVSPARCKRRSQKGRGTDVLQSRDTAEDTTDDETGKTLRKEPSGDEDRGVSVDELPNDRLLRLRSAPPTTTQHHRESIDLT